MTASPVNERYRAYLEAEYPISFTRGRYWPYLAVATLSVVLILSALSRHLLVFAGVDFLMFLIATRGFVGMKRQYQKEAEIAENWTPVMTALVQANAGLFRTGLLDLPCLVLFTFDRTVGYDYLTQLADRMGALKDGKPIDPDLMTVSEMVTNELAIRHRRRQLPLSFTGGPVVYAADLYVNRRYLEKGYITHRGMPCFVEPGETGRIELMPWQLLHSPTADESLATP